MGITEIKRKIWLFPENKIKSSESVSKQSTQLIVELNSPLWQKLGTQTLWFKLEFLLPKNEISFDKV